MRGEGTSAFVKLATVLPQIRAEAAASASLSPATAAIASPNARRGQGAERGPGNGPRVSALQRLGMPAAAAVPDRREGSRSTVPATRTPNERVRVSLGAVAPLTSLKDDIHLHLENFSLVSQYRAHLEEHDDWI